MRPSGASRVAQPRPASAVERRRLDADRDDAEPREPVERRPPPDGPRGDLEPGGPGPRDGARVDDLPVDGDRRGSRARPRAAIVAGVEVLRVEPARPGRARGRRPARASSASNDDTTASREARAAAGRQHLDHGPVRVALELDVEERRARDRREDVGQGRARRAPRARPRTARRRGPGGPAPARASRRGAAPGRRRRSAGRRTRGRRSPGSASAASERRERVLRARAASRRDGRAGACDAVRSRRHPISSVGADARGGRSGRASGRRRPAGRTRAAPSPTRTAPRTQM